MVETAATFRRVIVSAKSRSMVYAGRNHEESDMTQHALYVQLEAKPGKEQEVASFLSSARNMVSDEPDTTAWFAIRMGPRMFGIFDAFASERGRDAHLQGKLARQITSKADWFV